MLLSWDSFEFQHRIKCTTMQEEKYNKLLEVINTMLKGIGGDVLTTLDDGLSLRDDLEIDSISYAELVVILEDEFSVNINEPNTAQTIGDIKTRVINVAN